MEKILIIFGTRPEAIKMAPLVNKFSKFYKISVCVSAQHRQMLDQVLEIFNIKPDFDLDIMSDNQDLFDISSILLSKFKSVLTDVAPDLVLVHGDTTTSMIASLASYYLQIPVGHVEAGLRTHDIFSPYPEELNRQITSRIAKYHFAPSKIAKNNLIKENIPEDNIFVTGNTVIDAVKMITKKSSEFNFSKSFLEKVPKKIFDHEDSKIILVTGHRRENFGIGFENICFALKEIASNFPEVIIVYPVHLNPNVLKPVKNILKNVPNIFLVEPLDYISFIKLLEMSYIVLTDSGGVQEEAPSLGKPLFIMRSVTERPEVIDCGNAMLVGTESSSIIGNVSLVLENQDIYRKMSQANSPYGEGDASDKITKIIREV